ncbi:MAG: hypothetical protein KAT37_02155 [Candidatus Aenigmarchaeota archaeon]|nr:hypothetical protein [Candidatus Aenigmarchaeota archaeon]
MENVFKVDPYKKEIEFDTIGLKVKRKSRCFYDDLGYVPCVLFKTRQILEQFGASGSEELIRSIGFEPKKLKQDGVFQFSLKVLDKNNSKRIKLKKTLTYYTEAEDRAVDLWSRAYGEAQAAYYLGHSFEIGKMFNVPGAFSFNRNGLCKYVAYKTLRKNDMEPISLSEEPNYNYIEIIYKK